VDRTEVKKATDFLDNFFDSESDSDGGIQVSKMNKISPLQSNSPRPSRFGDMLNVSQEKYATGQNPLPLRTSQGSSHGITTTSQFTRKIAVGSPCDMADLNTSAIETIEESKSLIGLFVPEDSTMVKSSPARTAEIRPSVTFDANVLFDDSHSDGPPVCGHNIILSSSPIRDNDLSSSIGPIKPGKTSKPLIPKEKLAEAESRCDHGYDYDKRLVSSKKSNPFLDRLMSNASSTRQRYEKSRQEQAVLRKDREKERELTAAAAQDLDVDDSFPDRSSPIRPARSSSRTRNAILSEPVKVQPSNPVRTTERSKTDVTAENRAQTRATKQQQREELRRLKEANKVNRTKEQLLGEMIIHIPKIVFSLMKHKKCEGELEGIEIHQSSREDPCVTWQRKVVSEYDKVTDSFIPTSPHIIDEFKCCLIYDAKEFFAMMEMETLLTKFISFKTDHPEFESIIIILVEWEQLIQKMKNAENRRYTERMRDEPEKTKKRRKKPSIEDIADLQQMEETVAELQVNGFKIFTTKNMHETSVWLKSFTYAISMARYDKLERNPEFANIGSIRSGKDTQDVYLQMLLQFKFMTEVRAKRVVDVIPSLESLYRSVQNGSVPLGRDGKTAMNSNVESAVKKLFKSKNENELLHMK
jgi:hypothetical protein